MIAEYGCFVIKNSVFRCAFFARFFILTLNLLTVSFLKISVSFFDFCFFLKKKERIHLIIDSVIIAVADRGNAKNILLDDQNLGLNLIDMLSNSNVVKCVYHKAEKSLISALCSYTGSNITDIDIVFISLVLIALENYDGNFYENVVSVFPKAQIQRCIIHQIRSSTRFVSYKHIKELMADLKKVYQAISEEEAMNNLILFKDNWGKTYPFCVKSWEENWDILSTFFAYPPEVRKIIYTTNIIEGLNRPLRIEFPVRKMLFTQGVHNIPQTGMLC